MPVRCANCGALDDDAMNMDWTMHTKYGKVLNIECSQCGRFDLMASVEYHFAVVVEEEWDAEQGSE